MVLSLNRQESDNAEAACPSCKHDARAEHGTDGCRLCPCMLTPADANECEFCFHRWGMHGHNGCEEDSAWPRKCGCRRVRHDQEEPA